MKKDIIIFDFDDTIVESLKYWHYVFDKLMFKKYGFKDNKLFLAQKSGLSNKEIAELFIKVTKVNKTYQEITDDWNEYMYYFYTTKIKLIPGIKEFLFKLKAQGKRLILASATQEHLIKKALTHYGIDIFEEIFTETNLDAGKREKTFFEKLLKKLDAKPSEVFFFEDSFVSVKSAYNANIECCAVITKLNKKHFDDFTPFVTAKIKNYKNIEKLNLFN